MRFLLRSNKKFTPVHFPILLLVIWISKEYPHRQKTTVTESISLWENLKFLRMEDYQEQAIFHTQLQVRDIANRPITARVSGAKKRFIASYYCGILLQANSCFNPTMKLQKPKVTARQNLCDTDNYRYCGKFPQRDGRLGKQKIPGTSTTLSYRGFLLSLELTYANTSFTLSAASCNNTAECTFNPESSMIFFASSAFVPCKRTMIGTGIVPMFLYASTTP